MDKLSLPDLINSVQSNSIDKETLQNNLKSGIESKTFTILKIVEHLGELLTNKDTELRKEGTSILSTCLSLLKKSELSERELDFLITFYNDRLKDHHSVIPEVLKGLFHLCDMENLPSDAYIKLFPQVFIHFHCQSQLVHDRKLFYDILLKCIIHNVKGLQPMGPDFINGVIQSIDGERDPRNLIFLFSTLIPALLNSFELGNLSEAMFDVVSCYFPVDFSPRTDDPNAITREDLSNSLMPNLISKPEFAESCILLSLEKLESDLKVAKIDSLLLLKQATFKFSGQIMKDKYEDIWKGLKMDLNTGDPEIKTHLSDVLHALVTVLPERDALILLNYVYAYVSYSLTNNTDKALFISNIRLLIHTARDAPSCLQHLAGLLVPLLYQEINKTYSEDYILLLNEFLNLPIRIETLPCWNDLLNLIFKLSSMYNSIWKSLQLLSKQLTSEQRLQVYAIMNKILNQNKMDNLFEQCLQTYGTHFVSEVNKHVVIPFKNKVKLGELKNDLNTKDDVVENGFINPPVHKMDEDGTEISHVSCPCNGVEGEISFMEIYIKGIYCSLMSVESYLQELSTDVINFCLLDISNTSLLRYIVEKGKVNPKIVNYIEENFNVVSILIDNISKRKPGPNIIKDCLAVENILVPIMSEEKVIELLNKYLKTDMGVDSLACLIPLLNNISFSVLKTSPLWMCVEQLTNQLCDMCMNSENKSKHACILLAVIINNSDPTTSNLLDNIQNKLEQTEFNPNIAVLHTYVTKALLVKGHNGINWWVSRLIENLSNPLLGQTIVDCVRILVKDEDYATDYFQFRLTKYLFRQRLFAMTFGSILSNVKRINETQDEDSAKSLIKLNQYLALLVQLEKLPPQLVQSKAKQILPVIVDSLTIAGSKDFKLTNVNEILSTILGVLMVLLQSKPTELDHHMHSLLTPLLVLAQSHPHMSHRILSLECLYHISFLDTSKILPHKVSVIQELKICLDDSKRMVRRKAVTTLDRWFVLDSPSDDD